MGSSVFFFAAVGDENYLIYNKNWKCPVCQCFNFILKAFDPQLP